MSPVPQMLLQRAMPAFLRGSRQAPVLLPYKVGAFENGLLEARFRFRTARYVITVVCHLPAATDVDSGGQAPGFCVANQPAVGSRLARFCFVSRVVQDIPSLPERDGIGVNGSATAVQYVDQSLHCCFLPAPGLAIHCCRLPFSQFRRSSLKVAVAQARIATPFAGLTIHHLPALREGRVPCCAGDPYGPSLSGRRLLLLQRWPHLRAPIGRFRAGLTSCAGKGRGCRGGRRTLPVTHRGILSSCLQNL